MPDSRIDPTAVRLLAGRLRDATLDAAAREARQQVEAAERAWGGVGAHRRDAAAADHQARLSDVDEASRRLRSLPPIRWRPGPLEPGFSGSAVPLPSPRNIVRRSSTSLRGLAVGHIWPASADSWLDLTPLLKDTNGNGIVTATTFESFMSNVLLLSAEEHRAFDVQTVGPVSETDRPVPTPASELPPEDLAWQLMLAGTAAFLAGELAARLRLVEATPFHVLRQRDGAMAVMPLPEDEPGVDSQVVVTAPISPNAPPGWAGGLLEMDGYLAA